MITRLPRWVWLGGWVLAFIAGLVNVVGLLGFQHQAVTHLTGTASLLAVAAANQDSKSFAHFLAVIISFLAGAIISGFLIQDSTLRLGRRYGVALLLESVLLGGSVPFLHSSYIIGICLASCACGLQNAMASTYSGAIVRTTHLSGMFTDLGIFVGQRLRGLPADLRRAQLCLSIISGFCLGGVSGAVAYRHLGYSTLLIPAVLTMALGLGYIVVMSFSRSPRVE